MFTVNNNELIAINDTLGTAHNYGIDALTQRIFVRGNSVIVVNSRTCTETVGIRHIAKGSVGSGSIDSNTVSLTVKADRDTFGIELSSAATTGRTVANNRITVADNRATRTDQAVGIEIDDNGNMVSGNIIDMTNNTTYDQAIRLTANSSANQGSDNQTRNAGVSINDLGATNNITAKDL